MDGKIGILSYRLNKVGIDSGDSHLDVEIVDEVPRRILTKVVAYVGRVGHINDAKRLGAIGIVNMFTVKRAMTRESVLALDGMALVDNTISKRQKRGSN